MAKKEKIQLTPEEIEAKKIRRSNGWTRFWAIVVALALTAGVFTFARTQGIKASEGTEVTTSESGENSNSGNNNSSNTNSNTNNNSATPANSNTNSNTNNNSSSDNNSAAPADNGGNSAAPAGANDAESIANLINTATAKAANAGYDWYRNCQVEDIDVGSATETLNGIIKRVDSSADLNSVVGGFLGRGEKKETITKGSNFEEIMGNANYKLKGTSLQASDIQNLQVNGNTYTFTLPDASNPQKDNSTPIARLTDDFITHDEVAAGVKDALGALSFLLSVKSSDVVFKDIKVTAVIENGELKELSYSYYMDVLKLELSVATGTGHGTIEGKYSNFVY